VPSSTKKTPKDGYPRFKFRRAGNVATYDYHDENGALIFRCCVMSRRIFASGALRAPAEWSWSVKGVSQVLYRPPELIEPIALGNPVFIVEGEKDADRLRSIGVPATCNAGGAGKWKPEHSEWFEGADVVIIGDNDPSGQDHAEAVARALGKIAKRVRVVDIKAAWPEAPPKGDISDWLDNGGTAEALYALIEALPDWAPRPPLMPAIFDPWEPYIVPEFPFRILPGRLQDYVASQAELIGCDPSAMAMCALTAISGALDHRFAVKMMRGGGWWQNPRLWTLLVGDPSTRKTPAIDAAILPLEIHEAELRRDYQRQAAKTTNAARRPTTKTQRGQTRRSDTSSSTPQPRRSAKSSPAANTASWSRATNSSALSAASTNAAAARTADCRTGFWLKAYDGGPYGYDRISRGEIPGSARRSGCCSFGRWLHYRCRVRGRLLSSSRV
jgi:DNA primase